MIMSIAHWTITAINCSVPHNDIVPHIDEFGSKNQEGSGIIHRIQSKRQCRMQMYEIAIALVQQSWAKTFVQIRISYLSSRLNTFSWKGNERAYGCYKASIKQARECRHRFNHEDEECLALALEKRATYILYIVRSSSSFVNDFLSSSRHLSLIRLFDSPISLFHLYCTYVPTLFLLHCDPSIQHA